MIYEELIQMEVERGWILVKKFDGTYEKISLSNNAKKDKCYACEEPCGTEWCPYTREEFAATEEK